MPIADGGKQAHPGRWVGGVVGALVCLGIAGTSHLLSILNADGDSGRQAGWLSWDVLGVSLLGLPIAILGGRALLPAARSGDRATALQIGLGFGLLAPPIGAIEIVAGGMLPDLRATSGFGDGAVGWLYLMPFALVFSFVAAVLTVPAGLVWAALVRAIPESSLRRLEVPRPLGRIGARHAVALAIVGWAVATTRPYVAAATDDMACLDVRPEFAGAYAWDSAGQRLAVVTRDDAGGQQLILVDIAGTRRALDQPPGTGPSLPAVAPDGSVAWVSSKQSDDRTRSELWVADQQGSRSLGELSMGPGVGLAWWDGSWVLAGGNLMRARPVNGVIEFDFAYAGGHTMGNWGTISSFSSSADGGTIGWWAISDWPQERRFTVANVTGQRVVGLPPAAFAPSLDPGGRRVVYRDGPTGGWWSKALDGTDDVALVGDDWLGVRVAANGAVAAVPELVHRGQLCLTPGTPSPRP